MFLKTTLTNTNYMPTTTNKNTNEWDKKELGVLWSRKSQSKGETYLTGVLNLKNLGYGDKDVAIVCFKNRTKHKDTHPDVRIYLSEKKESEGKSAPATTKKTNKPVTDTKAKEEAPEPTQSDESNELI